jgi:hypothetical protein
MILVGSTPRYSWLSLVWARDTIAAPRTLLVFSGIPSFGLSRGRLIDVEVNNVDIIPPLQATAEVASDNRVILYKKFLKTES